MMKTFKHLEDYILVIAGYVEDNKGRWIVGKSPVSPFYGLNHPIVKLARYDISVIENFVNQIKSGIGFTPKQAELASKITTKYKRQLANNEISVEPIESGFVTFKYPLRDIDYRRRVSVENDEIRAYFPFEQSIIESLRHYARDESHGIVEWNQKERYWMFALTEYNIIWVYTNLVKQSKFSMDKSFNNYLELCKSANYNLPTLTLINDELVLAHASDSLKSYVSEKVSHLDISNITKLIDHSGICKYAVDETITRTCIPSYVARDFMLKSWIEVNSQDDMMHIPRYIDYVCRYPVVVYGSNDFIVPWLSEVMAMQVYKTAQENNQRYILELDDKNVDELDSYPILLTTNGLIRAGTHRQNIFQKAEKTIFISTANSVLPTTRLGDILRMAIREKAEA